LIDPTSRVKLLEEIYPHLKVSFLKARVAYALGLHHLYSEENKIAEQLFFECLYLIDILKPDIDGYPVILSELGTNTLLRFHEVLSKNSKYQYAIPCIESTLESYKIKGKSKAIIDAMLSKIAKFTRENHDYNRSIRYYCDILKSYQADSKINDVRAPSLFLLLLIQKKTNQQTKKKKNKKQDLVLGRDTGGLISTMLLEGGNFDKAERFLKAALACLPKSKSSERMDPLNVKLQLKLADLYLESYNYEKGIELLENLNKCLLPHGSRKGVLIKLTKVSSSSSSFIC
jgi:tetratricopeptide (TPR) repeat protein